MKQHFHCISRFSVAKRSSDHRAHFWLLADEERYFYHQLLINDGNDTPTGTVTISIQLTAAEGQSRKSELYPHIWHRLVRNHQFLLHRLHALSALNDIKTGHLIFGDPLNGNKLLPPFKFHFVSFQFFS